MASGRVYRRGKAWYLDIYTGRTVEGERERVRRRAIGITKADAQAELEEALYSLRRAAGNGGALDNNYPISSLAKRFKDSLKATCSEATASEYCHNLDRIIELLPCDFITEINKPVAKEAANALVTVKKLSANSANKSLDLLKRMLSYGCETKLIQSNELDGIKKLPKKRVKLRRDFRKEEIKRLLAASVGIWVHVWTVMFCTGIRLSEMSYLLWNNIDLQNKIMHIRPTDEWRPKSEAGIRDIPLSNEALQALKALPQDTTYVFETIENTARKNNVLKKLKTHLRRAKFTPEEIAVLDVHSIRYTFITELISNGVNPKVVQKLAGHADIKTTLNIYAQCRESDKTEAISNLNFDIC